MKSKHPGFYIFPGDWLKDPGIQQLSWAERGMWMHLLMVMNECSPRGTLAVNGKPIALEQLLASASYGLAPSSQGLVNLATFRERLLSTGVASEDPRTGALLNRRMSREADLHEAHVANGRKGGLAKASKRLANSPSETSLPNPTLPSINPPISPLASQSRNHADRPPTPSGDPPDALASSGGIGAAFAAPDKTPHPSGRAWSAVLDAVHTTGRYRKPAFADPLIPPALSAIGGWNAICDAQPTALPSLRARFLSTYRTLANRKAGP